VRGSRQKTKEKPETSVGIWDDAMRRVRRLEAAAQGSLRLQQLALAQAYRTAAAAGAPLPPLADVGFKCFSQNDEDGLLLFVFSLVGATCRVAVEIAAGTGIESNSANLIVNHGFTGLLFEADPHKAAEGERFFGSHPHTAYFPPRFVKEWVTQENVDGLVRAHMFPGAASEPGEIDLLSIDVDGNDYWILKGLTCVRPRVIMVEFNAVWQAERAVSIPYDPDFACETGAPLPYMGASLPAFVKLLRGRGYRLIGVERLGFNAVFVRNDLAARSLPEVTSEECLGGPIVSICQAGLRADPGLAETVRKRPWVEV
jgi:hypothetical protein